MSLIAFFTDEDMHGALAGQLRNAGFHALSTPEAGRTGASDPEQLTFATANGFAIVSHNAGHFVQLHGEYLRTNQHHNGIVVSKRRGIGDILRRLLNLARTVPAEDMKDRLEFLTKW